MKLFYSATITILFTVCLAASSNAATSKTTDTYKASQAKSMIKLNPPAPQKKLKIRDTSPLGVIIKPSLNGNFYLQHQYKAAQKRFKTAPTENKPRQH